MKENLKIIAILIGIIFIILSIPFCIFTNFGEKTGVYIEQKVNRGRLMDSTYSVETYVWDSNDTFGFMVSGEIEWSQYKTVKCYDVAATKESQYKEAKSIATRLKEFKKKGIECNP